MTKLTAKYIELHIFKEKEHKIKFLLLKRASYQTYPDIWQMVTGKIKRGEKAYESAMRELFEETGLVAEEIYSVPIVNSVYLPASDEISLIPVFVCRVKENSKVKISPEHSDFLWASPSKAIKLLNWEGQKQAVRLITDYWFNSKQKLTRII